MRSGEGESIEALISSALHPVDPPLELDGFERKLAVMFDGLADMADGLGEGERLALHDPRNWIRLASYGVLAIAAAGAAAVAAILFAGRRRR